MIQHGIKFLILFLALTVCSCTKKDANKHSAFKYVNEIFVGDVIFNTGGLSSDELSNMVKKSISNIGLMKEQNAYASASKSLLIVNISPLFIEKDSTNVQGSSIIEINFNLIAPANLAQQKDILIKGLLWEKKVYLNAHSDDFTQRLQNSLDTCLSDLNSNFEKVSVKPVFYM
jgi:hypothetical protein